MLVHAYSLLIRTSTIPAFLPPAVPFSATPQTKLDVTSLARGPMLLDVLQFMVGILKQIRPMPAEATSSSAPGGLQLKEHQCNAVRLVTSLLEQLQQVRACEDQGWEVQQCTVMYASTG
jgi:hypothetical protein